MSRLAAFASAALLTLCTVTAFAQAPAKSDSTKKKAAAAAGVPSSKDMPTCGGGQCQSKLAAKSTSGTAGVPSSKDMPNCGGGQCQSKLAAKSTTGTARKTNVGKGATKDSKSKTGKSNAIEGGVKPKPRDSTTKKP